MTRVSVEQFADKMSEIMPVIIKEFARRQTNEFYKGKLTFPQFLVLEFLRRKGESKMTQIANFMAVTTAAMTGIVDRLVKSGYVLRVPEPQDRRIIKIKLATKGIELVKKINQQRRQMIIKIFGQISERDRQDYLRILMHIRDILSTEKRA